jgi:hypothetical protein
METFLSQAWREKGLVLLMADAVPQTERRMHDVSETWWRTQSNSNVSRQQISLLTGKLTGNFCRFRPLEHFSMHNGQRIQRFAGKFPTKRNREFLQAYQGKLLEEQGIPKADRRKAGDGHEGRRGRDGCPEEWTDGDRAKLEQLRRRRTECEELAAFPCPFLLSGRGPICLMALPHRTHSFPAVLLH